MYVKQQQQKMVHIQYIYNIKYMYIFQSMYLREMQKNGSPPPLPS